MVSTSVRRASLLALAACLALLVDAVPLGPKVLVIVSTLEVQSTHSRFFGSLRDRGFDLHFSLATQDNSLEKYGVYTYDHIIIFTSGEEGIGKRLSVSDLVAFVDSGRNVFVATDQDVSKDLRVFANECGFDFDREETMALDHVSFDASDLGPHTLVASSAFLKDTPILGDGPSAPVLFRGIAHAGNSEGGLVTPVLSGQSSTISHDPDSPIDGDLQTAGSGVSLVSVMQTTKSARVVLAGSMDLFSDSFFLSPVDIGGRGKQKFDKSGNEEFATSLSKWVFHETGSLRAVSVEHGQQGADPTSPESYRIKDDIQFFAKIEEYSGDSSEWVPFTGNDVQLEFVMLDPYVRTTLKHNGRGLYSSKFKVPDTTGIYKFHIDYHRHGYSRLQINQQVAVRPFRHDEFERFIGCAFPYYAASFSMMGLFVIFGIVFLYHKQ